MSREVLTIRQLLQLADVRPEAIDVLLGSFYADGTPLLTYDPTLSMAREYRRRLTMRHDGTHSHTIALAQQAVQPLIEGVSYYKPKGAPPFRYAIRYIVGPTKRYSTYHGRYGWDATGTPTGGVREAISIPIRTVEHGP